MVLPGLIKASILIPYWIRIDDAVEHIGGYAEAMRVLNPAHKPSIDTHHLFFACMLSLEGSYSRLVTSGSSNGSFRLISSHLINVDVSFMFDVRLLLNVSHLFNVSRLFNVSHPFHLFDVRLLFHVFHRFPISHCSKMKLIIAATATATNTTTASLEEILNKLKL